jgi:hypothetical protein
LGAKGTRGLGGGDGGSRHAGLKWYGLVLIGQKEGPNGAETGDALKRAHVEVARKRCATGVRLWKNTRGKGACSRTRGQRRSCGGWLRGHGVNGAGEGLGRRKESEADLGS